MYVSTGFYDLFCYKYFLLYPFFNLDWFDFATSIFYNNLEPLKVPSNKSGLKKIEPD